MFVGHRVVVDDVAGGTLCQVLVGGVASIEAVAAVAVEAEASDYALTDGGAVAQ